MNDIRPSLLSSTILPLVSLRPRPIAESGIWRFTSLLIAVVATLCVLFNGWNAADAATPGSAQATLPSIELLVDGKPLTVELAATGQQRYMGLSFRETMANNAGMLFVYQAERPLTFTMRNTLIPLSIAFISKDLVINEIHHMNVGPGQLFDSAHSAQFALEVNQGWFAQNGIKPGAQIVMP